MRDTMMEEQFKHDCTNDDLWVLGVMFCVYFVIYPLRPARYPLYLSVSMGSNLAYCTVIWKVN